MKNIFIPPVSFLVPLIIIAVGLTWACYSIVLKNLNSKDIVFSFSAMAAAFAMFYLNISLSMKDEAQRFVINTHAVLTEDLVIDVIVKGRKSNYIVTEREKLSRAVGSELAKFKSAQEAGNQFDDDNYSNLISAVEYFYLNSILGSLLVDFPDWQMTEVSFKGGQSTSFNYKKAGAGDNAFIDVERLDAVMGNASKGYTLGGAVTVAQGLTLPPGTAISRKDGTLLIENPFLRLAIDVDVAGNFSYAGFRNDGEGKLVIDYAKITKNLSFYPNINVHAVLKKERSGNPAQAEYIKWLDRLNRSLKEGFE